jgi:hypothetical protein
MSTLESILMKKVLYKSQTKRAVVIMMSQTLPIMLMVAVQVEVLAKSIMEREHQWPQGMISKPQ